MLNGNPGEPFIVVVSRGDTGNNNNLSNIVNIETGVAKPYTMDE